MIVVTVGTNEQPFDRLVRAAGALDVVLLPTLMKKGRPGARLEVLTRLEGVGALEEAIFAQTATLGVRRAIVERRVLQRAASSVQVLGHAVRVKIAHGPGGSRHVKPEFEDVRRVAEATGRPARDIFRIAAEAAEHL